MEIRLELFNGDRRVLLREMEGPLMLLGSNPECHLCVPDESIANIQCLLRREGAALYLANRAAQGTRVGDETVMEELRLADGDRIELGPVCAVVRFHGEETGSGTRTLAPQARAAQPYRLIRVSDGEAWLIDESGVSLGTAEGNDVVLDDEYASGRHAHVALRDGRVMVQDLDSRNGVFLDEGKIGLAEARDGSTLRLGTSELRIERVSRRDEQQSLIQKQALRAWVGRSEVSERVRRVVGRIADNDAPVLVTGETGTGKEVTASMLHRASPRAQGPFVALNCGALSPSLIESELFGHVKGAFTGATGRKAGAFESANGGTLFLDEIGELPLDLQPLLLRALETGVIQRVGSNQEVKVDVRVVAATNRDLEAEVASDRFRGDLYHRLAVLGIELPTLRERIADVADLAGHFVRQTLPAGERVTLTKEAVHKLELHAWPGNVRELRNVIQRAVLMRASDIIDVDDIHFKVNSLGNLVSARSQMSSRRLADVERNAIIEELVRSRGNRSAAADALGISRSTLSRKMEQFEIDLNAIVRDPMDDGPVSVRAPRKRR